MKGKKYMRILKIDQNKGYFSLDGEEWLELDKLTKESILALLDLIISGDAEMDEYSEEKLKQPAHGIIYRNLYQKLSELSSNKDKFKRESESLYKESIDKYGAILDTE